MALRTSVDFLLGHKANLHTWQAANRRTSDAEALEMREHWRAASAWTYTKFLLGKKHWVIPSRPLQYHCGMIRDFLRPFIHKTLDRLDEKTDGNMKNQGH